MLEELLRFDKLGSKEELLFVLFKALPISETQKRNDLKRYCVSNVFSISRSFDGILKLLEFISFIYLTDDKVVLNKTLFDPVAFASKETYFIESNFAKCFFDSLKHANVIDSFLNTDALKYNIDEDKYYIRENLIPYKYISLRNLLLAIGFVERGIGMNSNHLLVNPNHQAVFKQIIDFIIDVKENVKRKRSIEQLKRDLQKKEDDGKSAEVFALQFEIQRLTFHPRISAIQRISEEYVNAGYDIESFSDIESIFIDRFIEVKSYVGEVSFFWTKKEVQIANELGDKYFLYLVDRAQMGEKDYKPNIFQNPYQKIFENEFWKKETDTWKITLE